MGRAIALGQLSLPGEGGVVRDRNIAVISGNGVLNSIPAELLMVLDVSDALAPRVLGYRELPKATDIALHGNLAIVGDTDRVHILDISNPSNIVELTGAGAGALTGMGGWVAVAETAEGNLVIFSTGRGSQPFEEAANGGVRSAVIVPDRRLASLLTPTVIFEKVVDDSANPECPASATAVVVDVYRSAIVSLRTSNLTALKGYLDSSQACAAVGAPIDLADLALSEGRHILRLPRTPNLSVGVLPEAFVFTAADPFDPVLLHQESGRIVERVVNAPVLPVGHMIVKGVDLKDGHLTRYAEDLRISGRNLDLHVTRSYASGATGGALGFGWSWNYASGLYENRECRCVSVATADGTSQLFHTADWQTFTPEKGYHTKLTALAFSGSGATRRVLTYEFKDKSGTIHRFSAPHRPRQTAIRQPVRYGSASNTYRSRTATESSSSPDALQRLQRILSRHRTSGPGAGPTHATVHSLRVHYDRIDRIRRIETENPLGLAVDYEYDTTRGDLVKVTRSGTIGSAAPTWTESVQIRARSPADGERRSERREDGILVFRGVSGRSAAAVQEIREFASPGTPLTTRFSCAAHDQRGNTKSHSQESARPRNPLHTQF